MPQNHSLPDSQSGSFKSTSKSQKIAIFSLSFVFLLIIGLGLWQIKSHIVNPYRAPEDGSSVAVNQNFLDETIDTDGDGLTDYDELYLYGTSPYLEDTDSDGISDYDEIMRGTDPNCAEGTNCLMGNEFLLEPASNNTDDQTDFGEEQIGEISVPEGIDEEILQDVLAGEINADSLRQLLIQSGADEELVNQLSDEDLLASYQEVLNNNHEE